MSVSAIFGSRMMVLVPNSSSYSWYGRPRVGGGLVIECSSRPQKKGTAHHRKTRPRKTQAWDIRRGPTVYPPLPPLPPEWTFLEAEAVPPPPPPPPETLTTE